MKVKRLLFFVMAISLASSVRAQFYDSANDLYYYIVESTDGFLFGANKSVFIFNFDGRKACCLERGEAIKEVQKNLKGNSDYYGAMVETKRYDMEYKSSSYGTCYVETENYSFESPDFGGTRFVWNTYTYTFSSDRKSLTVEYYSSSSGAGGDHKESNTSKCKRIDKNYIVNGFFGEGRQRK